MMKRRWSNNGGFAALKMLEESSSEVTSSSNGLVLSSDINMSPSSLDSPLYGDQEMWLCNDSAAYNSSHQHSVITSLQGCNSSFPIAQTTIIPMSALSNSNNSSTLNGNQNYANGSLNASLTVNNNGMTNLNGLGAQNVTQMNNSHSHSQSQGHGHGHGHSHGHTHTQNHYNSNHSNSSSHHTNGHMGIAGGGGGSAGGGSGSANLVGGLSVNINGPNIVSNAQQLNSLQASQNGQVIHANIGIHSIISNGLNSHHHPHHLNNSSMMHHAPRSESANSISSGEFLENCET